MNDETGLGSPDSGPVSRSMKETLEIPRDIRAAVDERDGGICRICGEFLGLDRRAQHHIMFGFGVGARRVHSVENIITVGWLPGNFDCHSRAHSNKKLFQEILVELASGKHKGVTALQLLRWRERKR